MYSVSSEVCHKVLHTYFNSDKYELIDYSTYEDENVGRGFLGGPSVLYCKVKLHNMENILNLTFFIKSLPQNQFYLKTVIENGNFEKEKFFYEKIVNNIKKYLSISNTKIIPDCYYLNNDIIILENLINSCYKTIKQSDTFDVDHCLAVLKSLAEFHAITLLYEYKSGQTFDKLYPDKMYISWYTDIKDKPGHKHLMTGIKAIKEVINKYYTKYPINIRDKFIEKLKNIPEQIKPSKLHRNCISHLDLWNNNMMFKYNKNNKIENVILIDFQLFAYNPPSLDMLMFLHLNSDKTIRENNLEKFILHYYEHFKKIFIKNNVDPDTILTFKNFLNSMCETLVSAIGQSITMLHFVNIPDNLIKPILDDLVKSEQMICYDRNDLILNAVEQSDVYKNRLFNAINELFDFILMGCDSKVVLNKKFKTLRIE